MYIIIMYKSRQDFLFFMTWHGIVYAEYTRGMRLNNKENDEENKKRDNKNVRNADTRAEHFMRMRFEWNDLIEDLIQEGQERGAFDNLRGKGKPLDLEQNPYGAEWELAHKLMKENDVLPPWIAKRNGIIEQIEQFRTDLHRVWARHAQAYRLAQGEGHKSALSLSWDDVCRGWEVELVGLNKQIAEFNLGRPSEGLEMVKLRLDRELERAGAARWLVDDSQ